MSNIQKRPAAGHAPTGRHFTVLASPGSNDSRAWRMVAYTGRVLSLAWGRIVLDLDGVTFRQKIPLLKDQRADQPLGYSTSIERTKRGIEASGKLVSGALADDVLQLSREGFPWQASMLASPSAVEALAEGAAAEINGGQVKGPLTIFRKWQVLELTVTVLGADSNTSTEAFTAADVERQRVLGILRSSMPEQSQLATHLIETGVPVEQALELLNRDTRARLAGARERG